MKFFKSLTLSALAIFLVSSCVFTSSLPVGSPSGHEGSQDQGHQSQSQVSQVAQVGQVAARAAANEGEKGKTAAGRHLGGVSGYEQAIPYSQPVQSYESPVQSYGSSYGSSYSPPVQSYGSSYSTQSYSPPVSSYGSSYSPPVSSYGSSYQAPLTSSYAAPVSSYSSSYSAPVQSYGSSYTPPVTTYEQPIVQTYQQSSYSNYTAPVYTPPVQSYGSSYQQPIVSNYSTSYQQPIVSSYATPSYSTPAYQSSSYVAPVVSSYQQPIISNYSTASYGSSYQAPVQSYGSSYQAPVQSYGSSYQAPVQSYGSSYQAPVQSYVQPVQSYETPIYNQSYVQPIVEQAYVAPVTSTYQQSSYVAPVTNSYQQQSYVQPSYQQQSYVAPVASTYQQSSYVAPVTNSYQQSSYVAPVTNSYQQQSYVQPSYQQQSYVAPVTSTYQQSYAQPSYQQTGYQQTGYQGTTIVKRQLNESENSTNSSLSSSSSSTSRSAAAVTDDMSTSDSIASEIYLPPPPPPPPQQAYGLNPQPYVAQAVGPAYPLQQQPYIQQQLIPGQQYNNKQNYLDTQPEFTQSWADFYQPPALLPVAYKTSYSPYAPQEQQRYPQGAVSLQTIGFGYLNFAGPLNPASFYVPIQVPYYYRVPQPSPSYSPKIAYQSSGQYNVIQPTTYNKGASVGIGKRSFPQGHETMAPYSLLVDHLAAAASEGKEVFTNISSIECPTKPSDYTCPQVLNLNKDQLKAKICEYETVLTGTLNLVPDTDKAQTRCGAFRIAKQDNKNTDEAIKIQDQLAVIVGKDCQLKSLLDTSSKGQQEVYMLIKSSVPSGTKLAVIDGINMDLLSSQSGVTKEDITSLLGQCKAQKSQN